MTNNPRLKNTQSKDFRYVYANGIAVQSGPGETVLIFGIKEDMASQTESILEEVAVILSLQTVKVLAMTLTTIVDAIESSGQIIQYDEEKFRKIQEVIKIARTANPSSTS